MFGISLHRLIIYLPILLSWSAVGFDLWALSSGRRHLHVTGSRLLKWAVFAALLAVATGFSLAGAAGLGSGGGVTGHAGAALLTTLVLAVLAYLRYAAENREDRPEDAFTSGWFILELIAALLVGVTAFIGFGL